MPIWNPPPTAVPTAHHTTHETGGPDVVAAIDGGVITTGAVAAARGGTGVATGLTVLNASNVSTGTLPDAQLSANVPRLNAGNVWTSGEALQVQGPGYARLQLKDLSQPADAKVFDIISWAQLLQVRSLLDSGGAATTALSLSRSGSLTAAADYYEKGRTTPMGHWIDVPYSAGTFTASAGTWTVSAANARTLCYALIGKTLVYAFDIIGTTVSGSPLALRIALPAGLGSASVQSTPFMYSDGVVNATGMAQMSGAAFVALYKDIGGGTTWPNSGNTLVSGTIAIRMP